MITQRPAGETDEQQVQQVGEADLRSFPEGMRARGQRCQPVERKRPRLKTIHIGMGGRDAELRLTLGQIGRDLPDLAPNRAGSN